MNRQNDPKNKAKSNFLFNRKATCHGHKGQVCVRQSPHVDFKSKRIQTTKSRAQPTPSVLSSSCLALFFYFLGLKNKQDNALKSLCLYLPFSYIHELNFNTGHVILRVENAREMATGYEDTYRDLHQPAVVIGGCFAVVAVLLSIYLIFQHLKSYTNPAV